MAKKKTQRKAKSFSEALGLEYLFNNTITDFFLGLILFFASVYVIIAMVSFLNTGAADQSILEDLQQGDDSFRTIAAPGVPSSPIGSCRSTLVSLPSCCLCSACWWAFNSCMPIKSIC